MCQVQEKYGLCEDKKLFLKSQISAGDKMMKKKTSDKHLEKILLTWVAPVFSKERQ